MRIRLVEEGQSRYPILGACPCGHGFIRTVTNNGKLQYFECGQEPGHERSCKKRFYHRGGENGQVLCAPDGDPLMHDFGQLLEENGEHFFESHLAAREMA
jgi:hypothetical protein